jgi:putative phosphoesterase
MKLIGIICDTHGLLREEAINVLSGSDLVLHAGDVGPQSILDRLNEIAPVIAVRGNVDSDALNLPFARTVRVEGRAIYMIHDRSQLALGAPQEAIAVVIFGHSHKPLIETQSGVLYLNPGSAGPRRFRLPVTVARLKIGTRTIKPEIVRLSI